MQRQSKADKAKDLRVTRAYKASCAGIQVPIMELSKISDVGLKAIAEGADDVTLQATIRAYVDTIRTN